MTRNLSNIPTGWTYAGFALVWCGVPYFVLAFCIPLFAGGHWIIGLLIAVITAYAFFRHANRIGKRAKRGLVRKR